jgi:hypothetical protein
LDSVGFILSLLKVSSTDLATIDAFCERRDEREAKKQKVDVSFSECNSVTFNSIVAVQGIQFQPDIVSETQAAGAFSWDASAEASQENKSRCIQFLNDHVQRKTTINISAAPSADVLTARYLLKGTIGDIHIGPSGYANTTIMVALELKKGAPSIRDMNQAYLQLMAASVLTTFCAPVIVLTDLSQHWYFNFFSQPKKITRFVTKNQTEALAVISTLVQRTNDSIGGRLLQLTRAPEPVSLSFEPQRGEILPSSITVSTIPDHMWELYSREEKMQFSLFQAEQIMEASNLCHMYG